jgi:HlyD family secretion protein
MTKKIIISGVLIFFGVLILSGAILLDDEKEIIEVYSTQANRKTIESRVFASGKMHPMKKYRLSAQIAGEITGINVKKGDYVKKGQVLVQLDKKDYEANQLIAQASLLSAKATLTRAEKEFVRQQKLIDKNVSTPEEFESSREQYEIAESAYKSAKATLLQSENNLSKTTLFSPLDGKVLEIKKEKGEIALGTDVLSDIIMVIADMRSQKAIVKVNENDIASVSLNDEADVIIEAVDIKIKGRVTEIEGFAETEDEESQKAVTTFKVVVTLDRIHPEILPGMSANVEILTDRHKNALSLPIRCVTVRSQDQISEFEGKHQKSTALREVVFKIEGKKVIPVPVEIGISSETDFEILSGIGDGDSIVSGDYQVLSAKLKNGSRIKIIDDESVK